MPANRSLEIGTGLFVLLGFAALAFLTTQLPGSRLSVASKTDRSYEVTARFDNVGDLKSGAPVTMAGVTVGRVTSVRYDTTEYKAVVELAIQNQYSRIPDDSWAAVETSGLLGAKYVGLDPGGSETYLTDKSTIENTQSAVVLEKLINRLFAAFASKSGGSDSEEKKK
ncbi:MAG: outer membrane lipid asymmetry maintenance protein MlaD [Proteobacteria bacterium]|nr:MAG: outer membrane lipid asymmetry maintenance protein MlaD [Pseudomonadota bacterium]